MPLIMTRVALRAAAVAFIASPLIAQPRPVTSAPPSIEVLRSVGTPDEAAEIQAITARVKSKFSTDTSYARRAEDALKRRDRSTVKSLFSQVAQVRTDQIWFSEAKGLALGGNGADAFRLASYSRPRSNPMFIMFTVGKYAVCIGGTEAMCFAAIKAAGYTPAT